jgi:exopolysaccharide biosynthesis polyprenyl glycosylphosphotransferase
MNVSGVEVPREAVRHAERRERVATKVVRRPPKLALCLLLCDLAALYLALPLAVWLARIALGPAQVPRLWERLWVFAVLLLLVPVLLSYRLYDNDRRRVSVSYMRETFATFHALCVFGFFMLVVLHGFDLTHLVATRELALFWLTALIAIPLGRGVARRYVLPRIAAPQRTLILGAGNVGQDVARRLRARRDLNIHVVGFLDNSPQPLAGDLGRLEVLGREADMVSVVRGFGVERIIVCFSRMSHEDVLTVLRESRLDHVFVSIVPRFFEIMASSIEVDDVAGIPVLDLQPARLSPAAVATKRGVDLLAASVLLPLLAPAFVLIAIAIKLDSPGPVFFRQERTGRRGRSFWIYKFRTMVADAEDRRFDLAHLNEVTAPLFKVRHDPRVTRMGRLLRRTSLDELPQLINVLLGDMSLVGPRPFVVHEANKITGWARRRLDVTPGMTGAWQVMGRNDMPYEEMAQLDYLYVTNWSLAWDISLLLQTIPCVLQRRGA